MAAVGKQHVLQMTDGLFMSEAYAFAKLNPDVAFREVDIDAMAADIYTRPQRYDVILVTNMFGDILSNEAVAFRRPRTCCSIKRGRRACDRQCGTWVRARSGGRGIANPSGLMLSVAMLMEWLGTRHDKPAFIDAARSNREPRLIPRLQIVRRGRRISAAAARPKVSQGQ